MRILIVAENASARFGGEAALPLHYYRGMRAKGHDVWLVTHARVRDELQALFPEDIDARIWFVADTGFHRFMWRLGERLPHRLAYATTGFLMRVASQWSQRKLAVHIVRRQRIDVVHQPIPVSPKEPSMLFHLGAPVVIGPMNGGMDFPPAFNRHQHALESIAIAVGRALSGLLGLLMAGKRQAALLLVANDRTRRALPAGATRRVEQLVENGVDFAVWRRPEQTMANCSPNRVTRFAFMGRLVDWKAVDLLLTAFARASLRAPMSLTIIGDGPERQSLVDCAASLGLVCDAMHAERSVCFAGWLAQAAAADLLSQHDVLVLPSLYECGGAVVLEAMAMGLPVIATNWGGPADYLDASSGVLVEPGTRQTFLDGLENAMTELAIQPVLRERLGKAALERVTREFDWSSKVDEMLTHFKSVLESAQR